MRLVSIASLSTLAGFVAAAPYGPFPLADGFPSPSPAQLKGIETLAGGSLPNGPLPTKLQPGAVAALQLIALNEIFEVAYFTDLLYNVTTNVTGYELTTGYNRTYIIEALTAIANQEQLHALGANGILASANATQIAPCNYSFPVSSFLGAITLAQTFTDVVLGVLPQGQTVWATDGGDELPLVNVFGSVIAQEAEQNGFYRYLQRKLPSAAPFLTTEGPAFAFTFLQGVIVGACPGVDLVGASIPTFGPLKVVSMPTDADSNVTYAVPGTVGPTTNSIVYLSGQNLPLTVPISIVTSIGGLSYFNASLPFDSAGFAKGLTIAALVNGTGQSFPNSSAVASATLYGPGIIEID